jgi:hypothetical protein
MSFDRYFQDKFTKVDLTQCQKAIKFKTKLKSPQTMNINDYFSLASDTLDIFNSESPSFSSRCYHSIDPKTGSDTNINFRRLYFYQNKTVNCGVGCVYRRIDKNLCTESECKGNPTEVSPTFEDNPLEALSTINADIVICFWIPWNKIYLIPALNVTLSGPLIFTLLILYDNYFSEDLISTPDRIKRLIITDAIFYNAEEMSKDLYFNYRKLFPKTNTKKLDYKKKLGSPDSIFKREAESSPIKSSYLKPCPKNNESNDAILNPNHNNPGKNEEEFKGYDIIKNIYENKNLYDHEFTLKDYRCPTPEKAIIYDKRSFAMIFLQEMSEKHILLSIFLKHSAILPTWRRILLFICNMTIIFFLNALFCVDYFIDVRKSVPKKFEYYFKLI